GGNRQVRKFVHNGDRGNIHGVAGVGFESADAAFAGDHAVVSTRHDVFGREQKFFEGCRDAALQQHRSLNLAQFAQQIEVLHVARADLENVDVGKHQLDLRDLHDFADDQKIELVPGFAQQLQPFQSQS